VPDVEYIPHENTLLYIQKWNHKWSVKWIH